MPGSASPPSERVRLARVALAGALGVPDVVRGESGAGVARVVTADGSELLAGVSAIAQSDGRYAIDLRLIARLVPLWPLAEHVRARVQAAAARAGLAALLGSVDVEFVGVLTGEEIEQAAITAESAAITAQSAAITAESAAIAVPVPPLPSASESGPPPGVTTSAPVPELPESSE